MSRPRREPSSRKGLGFAAAVAFVAALGAPGVPTALASESTSSDSKVHDVRELRHDLRVDVPATVAMGTGLVLYAAFLRPSVLPSSCRWCDGTRPDGLNDLDRFFRDALARPDPQVASTMSHVVAYGIAPVTIGTLMGLAAHEEGHLEKTPVDLLLVAEGTFAALTAVEILKGIAARERPGTHQIVDDEAHAAATQNPDTLMSFPSGHVGSVFAATAAAGTIATLRGYRLAPLVWICGSMLGLTAGFLRIAANQHYLSDTMGGAAVGVLVGTGVPLLFHRPVGGGPVADGTGAGSAAAGGSGGSGGSWFERASLTTMLVPGGRVLAFGFGF